MPKFSIVPEIINSKNIKFFDERDIEITLCAKTDSKFIVPFNQPFFIVDTFAKKTTKIVEIVPIGDTIELKRLGFVISALSVKSRRIWFKGQKRIYMLERLYEKVPESRRLNYIPVNHRLQKDISNKRIRIVGLNAGYPHYESEYGGCGPWREIDDGTKS